MPEWYVVGLGTNLLIIWWWRFTVNTVVARLISRSALACVVVVAGVGCEDYTPSNRDIGLATGTALGAGLGAVVGNQVGDPGEGVAIGAAAGALAGGLIGYAQDEQEGQGLSQEEVLRRQEAELQRQQREIEDLRRQRYQDDTVRSSYGGNSSGASRSASYPGNSVSERSLESGRDAYTYPGGDSSGSAGDTAETVTPDLDTSDTSGSADGSSGRNDYRY